MDADRDFSSFPMHFTKSVVRIVVKALWAIGIVTVIVYLLNGGKVGTLGGFVISFMVARELFGVTAFSSITLERDSIRIRYAMPFLQDVKVEFVDVVAFSTGPVDVRFEFEGRDTVRIWSWNIDAFDRLKSVLEERLADKLVAPEPS